MEISITTFKDIMFFESPVYRDDRGFFCETCKAVDFQAPFVQDNIAFSIKAGTVRGLHYQTGEFAQAKLVGVLSGSIYDVVVDLREGSATYGYHGWTRLYALVGILKGNGYIFPEVLLTVTRLWKIIAWYSIKWIIVTPLNMKLEYYGKTLI
jgi:hypothetical protein